jgi:hypothetical protein
MYEETANNRNFKRFSKGSGKRQDASELFQCVRGQDGVSDDKKRKSGSDQKNGGEDTA